MIKTYLERNGEQTDGMIPIEKLCQMTSTKPPFWYQAIKDGELGAFKIGKRWKVDIDEAHEFILARSN